MAHAVPFSHPAIPQLAESVVRAARAGSTVMFCCGAHVLRTGNGPLLIDLMERRLLTHLALNGAGAIHDFELALIGQTCESVARYVRTGEFGLWQETGRINDAAVGAARDGIGLGEAVGRMIEEEKFPHRQTSVLAAGVRLGVPVTVHVAIGQDIIHEHPNFDPAATGAATYADFLIYTQSITRLEGGRLSEHRHGGDGAGGLPEGPHHGPQRGPAGGATSSSTSPPPCSTCRGLATSCTSEAPKTDPRYYFRPYKTVLVRTVADGGTSFYVQGDHRQTVPALYDAIMARARFG